MSKNEINILSQTAYVIQWEVINTYYCVNIITSRNINRT